MPDVVLYDPVAKRPVRFTPQSAAGGESRLCRVHGRDDLVGLVPVTGKKYDDATGEKIKALVAASYKHPLLGPPTGWLCSPPDTVGVFGYFARRVPGRPVDAVLRDGVAPENVLPLALLVANAYDAVESVNLVTADDHPGNLLAEEDGRGKFLAVRRIDLLSSAGWWGGKYHHCRLLHWNYAEPELQGKDLSKVEITRSQDRFALGVTLFEILTGSHPSCFGLVDGPGVPERVAARQFIGFKGLPAAATVAPEVMEAFLRIPDSLVVLFDRCFRGDRDKRPSPAEWKAELKKLVPGPTAGGPRRAWSLLWPTLPSQKEVGEWVARNWPKVVAGTLAQIAAFVAAYPRLFPPQPQAAAGEHQQLQRGPADPGAHLVLFRSPPGGAGEGDDGGVVGGGGHGGDVVVPAAQPQPRPRPIDPDALNALFSPPPSKKE